MELTLYVLEMTAYLKSLLKKMQFQVPFLKGFTTHECLNGGLYDLSI